LSKVVGAFDCAAMDASQVAAYGARKLNLKCAKGQESFALDAYLTGVEKAQSDAKQIIVNKQKSTGDAAVSAELDAYLKG